MTKLLSPEHQLHLLTCDKTVFNSQDTLNKRPPPHQQQVLGRDPDGVREGVVVLVLHELLRVGRPCFDLRKREGSLSPDTSEAQ